MNCGGGSAHQGLLTAASAEGQKHVLALDEMTGAEKAHRYISRATDQDPYPARVREAVAREAESYVASYPEGHGSGLRYTAFDRHASIARHLATVGRRPRCHNARRVAVRRNGRAACCASWFSVTRTRVQRTEREEVP